jgi:RHS repeat-associated protein
MDGSNTLYVGTYEKRSNGDILHYISSPDGLCALLVTNTAGTKREMYYLYTDYQGSLIAAAKPDGTIVEFSYDAWGRRRKASDWTDYNVTLDALGANSSQLFTRGYTGHEHIDDYGLINMNGRVYDPRLGRILSPDNVVQAPDNTQSYNRYSYCLNNPLKYADPSGWSIMVGVNYYSDEVLARYSNAYWATAFQGSGVAWGTPEYYSCFTQPQDRYVQGVGNITNDQYQELQWQTLSGGYTALYGDKGIQAMMWEQKNGSLVAAQATGSDAKLIASWIEQGFDVGINKKVGQFAFRDAVNNGDWQTAYGVGRPGDNSGEAISDEATSNGDGHSFMDNANFSFNAAGLYYSVQGEALHNELYWVQKNGTIRSTNSIGNNYLFKRSYNITGELAEDAKIASKNFSYAGLAVSGLNMVTDFRFANTFDFAMGATAFLPGIGWAIAGSYFISNVAWEAYSGRTIGQSLELQLNKIGQ